MQPRQTFFVPAVNPLADSGLVLAGSNDDEIYYFSLGSRSTVPYVELFGGMYSNKILSWGEVVAVPPGEMVSVRNASFHKGDIAINTGRDYTEIPTRVTVPVPFKTNGDPRSVYEPQYPVDCRRAKRAYGVVAITVDTPVNITITGLWRESSYNTGFFPDGTPPGLSTYTEIVVIPANTKFGMFPLGLRAPNNIIPMCLPDSVTFTYTAAAGIIVAGDGTNNLEQAFYVLEY